MARDYDLTGDSAARAVAAGLVTEDWYRTPLPRPVMKALMKRSDYPATRDTVLLFGLMAVSAGLAIALMPSWAALPFGWPMACSMALRWTRAGMNAVMGRPSKPVGKTVWSIRSPASA